ncbi:hypothetical protein, partial [Pseudarthrobacter scleromae]|uniref:hypothetical protein n=1 Tax=Pseudarthrobacter scleromae TaxID=158897 RepID=UPI003D056BF8
ALDKTGKYGRITNVNVAHFSTHEMAQFSTVADNLLVVGQSASSEGTASAIVAMSASSASGGLWCSSSG